MITRDYNGQDIWTSAEISRRYQQYALQFDITTVSDIKPNVHEEQDIRWIYPVMDKIIDGIKQGDLACAQIGIEFIEEDRSFPFGAILKSNTARALRQCSSLTDEQISRIRTRLISMFLTGIVPREYREYSKLLRRIGFGERWPLVAAATPRNHYAARAHDYFINHCDPRENGGT